MRLTFSPAARRDIYSISEYYRDISEALSERFIDELHAALRSLLHLPGMGTLRFSHLRPGRLVRAWKLDCFPFLLYYSPDEHWLELLRVLHERRHVDAEFVHTNLY